MAKITEIQLWSKERDEHGFPRRCNVYQLGPTIKIGDAYTTPLFRVRDNDYKIGSPPSRVKASNDVEARSKAIEHLRQEATRMKLDLMVIELPGV